MKSKNDKSEKNISRLLKQSEDRGMPSEKFTEDLIAKSLNELTQQQPGKKNRVKSVRLVRLAQISAAAVIIIAIGLFVTYRGPRRQINAHGVSKIAAVLTSPDEMMTAAAIRIAYRRGGMEEVEKQCEKAFEMLQPQSTSVTIQELLTELNGKNQKGQNHENNS